MWIVRNKKNNELKLFHEKPVREKDKRILWWKWPGERWVCPYFERFRLNGENSQYGYLYYGLIPTPELFVYYNKTLTWDDEPVEVNFEISVI